jgi:peptidyl-prolyl cis-trans isomerase B (cyclophilin B)
MNRSSLTLALASLAAGLLLSMAGEPARAADPIGVEALQGFIAKQDIDKSKPSWKTSLPRPPKVRFDPKKSYFWMLETNIGSIKVKLMPKVAPMHVSSTIYLTELGFYDNTPFHRVITGFMAQGGDPLGKGTGGPGYMYSGEFSPKVKHDEPGMLSMANRGPGTDGSQFFLTFVPTPWLDGKHSIFGQVVEGMGTVKELEKFGSAGAGTPTKPLKIVKATIQVQ